MAGGHNGPHVSLACSSRLGPGHLRFYCIPILLISKLPTPMKFGISLQLKTSGQKHILPVLCQFMEVLQTIMNNESGVGTKDMILLFSDGAGL